MYIFRLNDMNNTTNAVVNSPFRMISFGNSNNIMSSETKIIHLIVEIDSNKI